ncbi:MAG: T9SS type A sorting domain-containing protein [Candidatus Aegiribacteria sp.]|nr:T9SS type A sorting domain-containing protein [Candidatus Aegiribacteria sp.]
MLGSTYVSDGSSTSNVENITGISGTIVDGISMNYMHGTAPDKYVDVITPNGGAFVFESQDSKCRVICYAGPSNNYRIINSAVVFGVLRDGTTTKNELMKIYMDYLTGTITGIEGSVPSVNSPALAIQNPCHGSVNINLSLPSRGNVSITLYDMTGHLVGEITDGYMAEGSHSIIWNAEENRPLETGTYLLLLQTEEHTVTRKILVF